ncbi:MAG: hypothetical protein ACI83N_001919 [Hydrogenophaga sp.]|jgi:hypothetical protein
MQFNGADAWPQRDQRVAWCASGLPRLKQPLDSGNQEVAMAERRLQQTQRIQGLVGGVAAQIEDEIGHPALPHHLWQPTVLRRL